MDRGVSSPDRYRSTRRRLPRVLRQRLLRRTDRRVARGRQAPPRTGRRDADQLGRRRVRVGARLHVRRAPQGQSGGHEERCRRWARPRTGFRPELDRREALRRTRTEEETDGETNRPREQVCAAWANDLGAEELAAFFTDDAVYHNIPFKPVTGRKNIADNIASFIRPGPPGIERIEFRVINIAANGPVVMTERVDVFTLAGKTL